MAWAGLLFWLSAQPGPVFKTEATRHFDFPGRDYFAHGALYFVLGGLAWLWARAGLGVTRGLAVAVAVGFAVLYGVSDEWHQSFVPGRTPDVKDVLADGLGATAAAMVLWISSGFMSRRLRSSAGDGDAGG